MLKSLAMLKRSGSALRHEMITTYLANVVGRRKTLIWDRRKELSGHASFMFNTGTKVFFADPCSPWQRPTIKNTTGLLPQYFPKGADLSRWTAEDFEAVAPHSTTRLEKSSASALLPRYSRSIYTQFNSPVLQQLVELALCRSGRLDRQGPPKEFVRVWEFHWLQARNGRY